MKKIFIITIVILWVSSHTYAQYSFNEKELQFIEKTSNKIEEIINNGSPKTKNIWTVKIKNILNSLNKHSLQYDYLAEILQNHMSMDLSPYQSRHYSEFNINQVNIENYWLGLHNNSRNSRGLASYSYDNKLNNTAIEWSYNNYEKQSMDHKRDAADGWYNYPKIENWFQERGVHCKVQGGTTSSESIGKFGYYCRDGECSDELKESLEAIYDIFIGEEFLSYPENAHYLAIVSPHIQHMGLGISIYKSDLPDYYEYYMATHYCTEFK